MAEAKTDPGETCNADRDLNKNNYVEETRDETGRLEAHRRCV